jgi:putative serine protease PepD
MTDTSYAPQHASTTPTTQAPPAPAQPDEPTVQQPTAWPVNAPYQNDVPQWPPAQPPVPPTDSPVAPDGATPHRRRRRTLVAAAVAALVIAGGVAGGAIGAQIDNGSTAAAGTTATAAANTASSSDLASVVDRVSPSIVTVKVNTAQGTAEGSGIILTADGRVVTNNHVVEGAAGSGAVRVTLADGRTVPATVVGTNPTADIAVLQLQGVSGLTPATLGDSSSLQVGDTVLAFGSPLGLEGTVTSGIVSATNRTLDAEGESLSGLLQTDAPINPGNSGGALVNTAGQVVGINVAIATTGQDSGSIGVGFAIPIDQAKSIVDKI